jgi:hypothetical protein
LDREEAWIKAVAEIDPHGEGKDAYVLKKRDRR